MIDDVPTPGKPPAVAPRTLEQYANEVQGHLDAARPKASVNEITLGNGQKYQGQSGFLDRGGKPHPLVEEALGNVKKPAPWHGECGEIENLTRILNEHPEIKTLEQAREFFKGSTSESAFVRPAGDPAHGTWQWACASCKDVLKAFGIASPKP